jgi:hypothetical protein
MSPRSASIAKDARSEFDQVSVRSQKRTERGHKEPVDYLLQGAEQMPPDSVGAFAIVPSNDLKAAIPFWERLGFKRTGGDEQYVIMSAWDCEVHLTQAGDGQWRVPEANNPFGVFIRTPHVDDIAARVDDLVIRPGGVLRHREWGLYEVGICGPDGLLVRIGWPSRLMKAA